MVPTQFKIRGRHLNNLGSPEVILGGLTGIDMYLICSKKEAVMIDLRNNYINGSKNDQIALRDNAQKSFSVFCMD